MSERALPPVGTSNADARGVGPAIFLGLISLLFAALACFFFWQNQQHERVARTAKEQERLLQEENRRCRGELERAQTAFAELTKQLRVVKSRVESHVQDQALVLDQIVRQRQQNETVQDKLSDSLKKQQQDLERDRDNFRKEKEAWSKGGGAASGGPSVSSDDRMAASFSALASPAGVMIGRRGNLTTLRVQVRYLLTPSDADLTSQGDAFLRKLAGALAPLLDRYELIVEGHTDAEPVAAPLQKRFATNWELSSARAMQVVRFLVDKNLVPANRVAAVGRADSMPISKEKTSAARALNRRIEFVLSPLPSSTGAGASR